MFCYWYINLKVVKRKLYFKLCRWLMRLAPSRKVRRSIHEGSYAVIQRSVFGWFRYPYEINFFWCILSIYIINKVHFWTTFWKKHLYFWSLNLILLTNKYDCFPYALWEVIFVNLIFIICRRSLFIIRYQLLNILEEVIEGFVWQTYLCYQFHIKHSICL